MNKPQNDFQPLGQLLAQNLTLHAVLQSVRIGLFDVLQQPKTAEEVARQFAFLPGPTEALLDMFVANGFLTHGNYGYETTPTANEYLVTGSTFYQGLSLELNNRFTEAVKQQFLPVLKGESFEYQQPADDQWATEDTMQGSVQYARLGALQDTVQFIADLPNFHELRFLADIGGNHGEFSLSLLKLHSDLQGVILDLPDVVETANARIVRYGQQHRIQAVAHNLRSEPLPSDTYDLAVASHILYAFAENLPEFMGNVRNSLLPGGWFVTQHMNSDSGTLPEEKASLELLTRMMGYPTHYFTKETLQSAMTEAGFVDIRIGFAGNREKGLIVAGQRAY